MRICIYGAGAMGTSLGNGLLSSGADCDFVTRNRTTVTSLQEDGKHALLPEEMDGVYDVIFLATKQRDNPEIAAFLLPFLKEDSALVTVQNGLPERALAEVVGADRVYGCTLGWGAEMVEGKLKETSKGEKSLALGAYGKGDKTEEIASLLRPAFHVEVGNLQELRFSKLVVNAAFSTLSCMSALTFGEIVKKYKKLALALMRETVEVAKACGCRTLVQNGHDILKFASSPFAGFLLPIAMKKHASIRSGMLRDIQSGRRCDVDFVAGAVVKEGALRGVQSPLLERAVALVHDVENGLAELAPDTPRLLCD